MQSITLICLNLITNGIIVAMKIYQLESNGFDFETSFNIFARVCVCVLFEAP